MEEPDYFSGSAAEWGDDADGGGVRKGGAEVGIELFLSLFPHRESGVAVGLTEASHGRARARARLHYPTPPPLSCSVLAPSSTRMRASVAVSMYVCTE